MELSIKLIQNYSVLTDAAVMFTSNEVFNSADGKSYGKQGDAIYSTEAFRISIGGQSMVTL